MTVAVLLGLASQPACPAQKVSECSNSVIGATVQTVQAEGYPSIMPCLPVNAECVVQIRNDYI
jgi:hypothetical protein